MSKLNVGTSHGLHILCLNAAHSCFDAPKPWPLLRSDPLDPFVRQLYSPDLQPARPALGSSMP